MWNDVEALRGIARSLLSFSDNVGAAAHDAQTSDPGWVSTAAAGYRGRVDTAASTLRTRSQEISDAAAAMFTYADAVEDHIADLAALANALGKDVNAVWDRIQDGATTVADLVGSEAHNLEQGLESALPTLKNLLKGSDPIIAPLRTTLSWL